MAKEMPSRLRQMIEERDLGRSELRAEFDRSREDDASISHENLHLKDSYFGQRESGADPAREKTMVEQERPEPRPTPPRTTGPLQDRITAADRLAREHDRATQENSREEDRELGDDERSRDEGR